VSTNGINTDDPRKVYPLTERGYVSTEAAAMAGFMPSWVVLEANDELETNTKLIFPSSIDTYHNMRTDPQVQGLLTGAIWPLLRMEWYINPNNAPEEMVQHIATDLNLPIIDPNAPPTVLPPDPQTLNVPLKQKRDPSGNPIPTPPQAPQLGPPQQQPFYRRRSQNRFNFLQHLEEALDSIAYGFEVFEQLGYIGKDGKFHYRKLAMRPPQTITEIRLHRDGGINYIKQGNLLDQPLTIDRLVVYSFQKRGANWHGRSMLRGCYAPWLLKDRAMRVGVMNIQRAGVGTPIAQGHPGATETDLRVLSEMTQKLVAGDRSGGAIPYGATLKLIGVEGGQPDTVGFIKLMNEEMARSFFQMFMQLGQTTSGSRALGSTFVEYHKLVTEYIAQWFAMVFNEHVIEDDIDWNWGPEEEYAPLLEWRWDEKGSDQNPEGPAAAKNPAQQFQQLHQDGKLQVDNKTAAMLYGT
jgi:hypothetical protein